MPSSSGRGLQGTRPHPLKVSKDAMKAGRSPAMVISGGRDPSGGGQQCPLIFYLHSPKVIHAKPQEFMSVVQRLTGKDAGEFERSPSSGAASGSGRSGRVNEEKEMERKRDQVEEDPLLLTLGQSPSASAWNSGSSSSASMASPGLFLSSPNLNACLQEFGSLF